MEEASQASGTEQVADSTVQTDRPNNIPEKFWDSTSRTTNVDAMADAYSSLEKSFTQKTDDLRQEIETERFANRPETKDDYSIPEIEGIDFSSDDPLLTFWKEQAHSQGLDQSGFEAGIKAYHEAVVNVAPNYDAELKKLGEDATTRIDAVKAWSETSLSENTQRYLSQIATTAEGVTAIEELMGLSSKSVNSVSDQPSAPSALTMEDLQGLMNTSGYWDNSGKRDMDLVRKVEDGFKRLNG